LVEIIYPDYTALSTNTAMVPCPFFFTLSALPILWACTITAQTAQQASAAPSPSNRQAGIEHVSFPTADGGLIYADVYGKGDRGVVLALGGRFTKESWRPQAQ